MQVCYAYNKSGSCTNNRWVKPSEAAKAELDSLKSTYSDADVYTIAFGSQSGNSLSEINPASSEGATPIYVNYSALTGDELKAKFDGISDSLVELIGKDSIYETFPDDILFNKNVRHLVIDDNKLIVTDFLDHPQFVCDLNDLSKGIVKSVCVDENTKKYIPNENNKDEFERLKW